MDNIFHPELFLNKIILYEGDLVTIDLVDDTFVYIRKLESDAELVEVSRYWLEQDRFDFGIARRQAVDVMNQTRYYDNKIKHERGNPVI